LLVLGNDLRESTRRSSHVILLADGWSEGSQS